MHHNYSPSDDGRQAPTGPIDLTGCSFAPIPGTRIALVIPSALAELRLNARLNVAARLSAIRAEALGHLAAGAEAFAQQNHAVGNQLYLSVSILTTHTHWRGGWLLYRCPPGEETAFVEYLAAARDMVVADLRKERLQRGSRN
jgi:hypothetical protein